jgi:hypothetical protein
MTVQMTTIEDDDADGTTGLDLVDSTAGADDRRRDSAVRVVLRLIEANRDLQTTLSANAAHCEETLLHLMGGASPGQVLDDTDVSGCRISLADAMTEFERARHQARGTFISAQYEGGMNMKEIGGRWGISRQLAHRFYKEARREG